MEGMIMVYVETLANIGTEIDHRNVERDARIVTEFLDYWRWLAEQDTGFQVTVGQIWELYYMGVGKCRMWSEVCEDIGLPVRDDWD
jgi:hypothetical protein